MNHSEKLVFTPYDSDPPNLPMATDQNVQFSSKRPKPAHPQKDKEEKWAKIICKLALIQAYDDELRVKNEEGRPIHNSNIISLLNVASKRSEVLLGYDDFILMLYKANINPEWIINDDIKLRLLRLYQQTAPKRVDSPPPPPLPPPPLPSDLPVAVRVSHDPPLPGPPQEHLTPGVRKLQLVLEDLDAEAEWDEKQEPAYKKRAWIYPDNKAEDTPLPMNDDEDDEDL